MAAGTMSTFIRELSRAMAAEALGDRSDRELIEQFLAGHSETAFAVLVRRHGPMVYRVCWRVSQHTQDAEDAFQATFFVLAQKLGTLRKHASLASWLHGVAYRIALKAEAQAATRRRHEHQAPVARANLPDSLTWGELRSVLDAELAKLPDKWRLPLVLCYLEGRTQDEAARQLGWGKNTLRRRLEEAREALGRRLGRCGVAVPAALSSILLSDSVVSAALPSSLVASTVVAAARTAAGQAVGTAIVSAKVAALAEGVLRAMFMKKLKIAIVILLAGLLVACGARHFAGDVQGDDRPKSSKDNPRAQADQPKPAPTWKEVASFGGHKESVDAIAISPDLVATSGSEGVVRIWDIPMQKVIRSYQQDENKSSVLALHFSPDGKFVSSIGENGGISVVSVSAGNKEWRGVSGSDFRALGPDHKSWLAPLKNEIGLWDVDFLDDKKFLPDQLDAGPRAWFKGHKDEITALAFALHDDSFASGSKDKTVIVWDRTKKAAKFTGEGHSDAITSLAFEDNGKYLASASKDGTARLWDLTEKKKHQVLKAHEGAVLAVAFSLDGKLLATAGEDKVIRLWDVTTANTVMTLKGHTETVKCLNFSRDGKYLASGSADKTVKLWEVKR